MSNDFRTNSEKFLFSFSNVIWRILEQLSSSFYKNSAAPKEELSLEWTLITCRRTAGSNFIFISLKLLVTKLINSPLSSKKQRKILASKVPSYFQNRKFMSKINKYTGEIFWILHFCFSFFFILPRKNMSKDDEWERELIVNFSSRFLFFKLFFRIQCFPDLRLKLKFNRIKTQQKKKLNKEK